jgi:hypothetical protein
MPDRREYPSRGGRHRRRPFRLPAAALLTCLVFGVVAAPGLGGCGRPDRGASRASESGDFASEIEAPADSGPGKRLYRIAPLSPSKLELDGAAVSMDDLVLTLEVALARHDTTRLLDLMIDEREYRDILYPAFPAAHPPINAGFETLWITHYPDAWRGLMLLMRDYGGRDVRVMNVRFDRPDQDFVNFTLHETSHVDVEIDGVREDHLRLFGSVVRVGNQWKVLSYPDD